MSDVQKLVENLRIQKCGDGGVCGGVACGGDGGGGVLSTASIVPYPDYIQADPYILLKAAL